MGSFYNGNICYGTTDANQITTKVGNDTTDFNLQTIIGRIITDLAPISTATTTRNFAIGQYLVYNGQFYRVITEITTGDELNSGTGGNILLVNINSELNRIWTSLNTAITGITRTGLNFTASTVGGGTVSFNQQDNNTTYTAGNKISINGSNNSINHIVSGVVAGTYGEAEDQTPSFGDDFKVLSGTVDTYGHLTAIAERNITIPTYSNASSQAAGLMSAIDKTRLDNIDSTLEGLYYEVIKQVGSEPTEESSEG